MSMHKHVFIENIKRDIETIFTINEFAMEFFIKEGYKIRFSNGVEVPLCLNGIRSFLLKDAVIVRKDGSIIE